MTEGVVIQEAPGAARTSERAEVWRLSEEDVAVVPLELIEQVGAQIGAPAAYWAEYAWAGRVWKRHRQQIRERLGFRRATVADAQQPAEWPGTKVIGPERNEEHLVGHVRARCREMCIEPPTLERNQRIARSALNQLRADAGRPSGRSVQEELAKLSLIWGLRLPADLFHGVSSAEVELYRQRVAVEAAYELRRHAEPVRLTWLAAYAYVRGRQITDTLVDLLIDTIHGIGVRAERKVEREMLEDLRRVTGKQNLLFRIADAALQNPDERVRDALFPVVSESVLKALVKEWKATGPTYRTTLRTVIRSPYRSHYRRMVPALLEALSFQSNNEPHRPVIEALDLLKRYRTSRIHNYPLDEEVPIEGGVRGLWKDAVLSEDGEGEVRVNRITYEICALEALREKLRCKEIWVNGADRYRNPEEDLPQDFEEQRETYYAAKWHLRYGGPGIMVYWHVEKKSLCIYSQLKTTWSSEAASMIEGVLRHCTDADVERQYVDSHGQSEVAFAFCRLLGFELLPRLKAIQSQRLYRPAAGMGEAWPCLVPVLTRPIDWAVIRQQYDQLVKYATALRLGTAKADAILRRFTRSNVQHPTCKALGELGKAVKTIFLCRYLQSAPLRREIHEGLNVIEQWNGANDFIFFGRKGDFTSNRKDDQEESMLARHLLQNCLVYVNTLIVQRALERPHWQDQLTTEDLRALTPLIWEHVNPYGTYQLDLDTRLALD